MNSPKKKIFVGLSGGVDSSVAAALLRDAGHEVTGVFIKVWQADFLPCTWREERREAMRAAAHLGIPFLTLDLEREYKEEVVDYMIREYGAGRIPNPDVMCNKYVKFGAFLAFARSHGVDAVATGHYAQVLEQDGRFQMLAGVDPEKDQSYFLWTLSETVLPYILFPVGHLLKSEVRALAESFGLPNAHKKDSQGLCFMGQVDMAEFLKHYLDPERGAVLDKEGKVIGTHEGALLYTIGQRRGFSTEKHSANEAPYVVVSKDLDRNTITVAHPESLKDQDTRTQVRVSLLNEIVPLDSNELSARIRYRGEMHSAVLTEIDRDKRTALLRFTVPVSGIAAGQSVVFYRNSLCMGGAVLDEETES